MFALTRKTDYGIIALSHMARRPGEVCTARDIAERYHLSQALLMNVLKCLGHSDLLVSTRGVKGGYQLARPAEDTTLTEIISAVEGPIHFVQCAGDEPDGPSACDLICTCPVSRPIRKVHDKLVGFLNQITLAQIAGDTDYCEHGVALSLEGVAMKTESCS